MKNVKRPIRKKFTTGYLYLCPVDESNLNFKEFKNVNRALWEETVNAPSHKGKAKTNLVWTSEFEFTHKAYYDASDLEGLNYLHGFSSRISKHKWRLYEHIDATDVKDANSLGLKALNMGCNGLLFSLNANSDLAILTNEIHFEHCEISFLLNDFFVDDLENFKKNNGITGFVLASEGPHLGWHSDRFSQKNGLENLSEMVIDYAQSPKKFPAIFLSVGKDFFSEMARIRALKYLFWRVANVADVQLDPNEIWIHCEANPSKTKDENLFELTTASLSAVIGGANSISYDSNDSKNRINRNIGNLIRDEAKIEAFENAGLGSFFIDHLTDQMIRHVWGKLQEAMDL